MAGLFRQPNTLDDLKERFGEQLWTSILDVTDTAAVRRVMDSAFAALGQIDVVVNNAGYGLFCAVEEASDDQIEHQIKTNIIGSIQVIRAALPHLRSQKSGRILQISSSGGQTTYPNFSYYHTSKWGIEGFCETIAQEILPFNIGLTIVEPGAHGTSFGSSLVTAPVMEAYDNTPAGEVRKAIAKGTFPVTGDVLKTVQAMIDVVEIHPAPLRLALGRDAYFDVRASLVARLTALDAQKDLALSSDITNR